MSITHAILAVMTWAKRNPVKTVLFLAVLFIAGNLTYLLAGLVTALAGDKAGQKAAAMLGTWWGRAALGAVPFMLGFPLIAAGLGAWWALDLIWPNRGTKTKEVTES